MALVVYGVLAIVGIVLFVLLLRHYRRQEEYSSGPGVVPEDYD